MKTNIFPAKLKKGDKVMVVAPSDSLKLISESVNKIAYGRLTGLGFKVVYADNVNELDELDSSSIESRAKDLHQAFLDKEVKMVIAAFGGYNANELLRYIDWQIIKDNPKIFIGFSDTTVLQNAIYAKTGLVTYSGPTYATFGQERYFDDTLNYFKQCLCSDEEFEILPSQYWGDDWWLADQSQRKLIENGGWWAVNEGKAVGKILGGNICTFNLLQGTEYLPDITDSILFLEDDVESKLFNFNRDLQSIIHLPNFARVRGIVIGRFQKASQVERAQLEQIIKTKPELCNIPILANVDFGHTNPICTFPVGGKMEMTVGQGVSVLKIVEH